MAWRGKLERDGADGQSVAAVEAAQAMKASLFVASAILLAGCSPAQGIEIVNETGVLLSVRVVQIKVRHGVATRAPRDQPVAVGGRGFVQWQYLPQRLVLSAGRCEYDYGSVADIQGRTHEGRIRARFARNFSIQVETLQSRDGESGYFPDVRMEGFPVMPVKTCH